MFDPTENLATVLKRYRAGEFDIVWGDLPNDQIGWLRQNMPKDISPFARVVFNGVRPVTNV
jgi:hypothetical protein